MWEEVWQNDCNCEVTKTDSTLKKIWNVANSMDMFSVEDPNTLCHYQIETNNAKGIRKFRFGQFISKGCTVTIFFEKMIDQLFNSIKIDWVNNKIWPVIVLKYSTKVYLNFKFIFPQKSPSCHFFWHTNCNDVTKYLEICTWRIKCFQVFLTSDSHKRHTKYRT